MARHQIDSWEFEMWLDQLYADTRMGNSKESLYDLWEQGYSAWEVDGILG